MCCKHDATASHKYRCSSLSPVAPFSLFPVFFCLMSMLPVQALVVPVMSYYLPLQRTHSFEQVEEMHRSVTQRLPCYSRVHSRRQQLP